MTVNTETVMPTAIRDRVADAVGRVEQVARQARKLETLAADAVEDGVHAAKRAMTRGAHEVEDWRDAAAYRVKNAPLLSIALAAGAGMILGIAMGRCASRARRGGDDVI